MPKISTKNTSQSANKAFKSDSQRLAVSLRSSIAKRRSHLNAALCVFTQSLTYNIEAGATVCIFVFGYEISSSINKE
ncbi:urease accessory protein UreD [Vibrio alginolyticus]|nr:urease accessory protein UreD [Vibrio alginolyticus]